MKKKTPKLNPSKKLAPETHTSSLQRAKALGLWGLVEAWEEVENEPWMSILLDREETARKRRSLERRLRNAKVGRFKPMADFDWAWPTKIDRTHLDDVMRLDFVAEGANVILMGPNGVGKTTIAQNIAHAALLGGHTVHMTTASEILCDLVAQDGTTALMRKIRRYASPAVLVIDELGYLASSARHADLLFEVITRRYKERRPVVLTTNKPFAEWGEVFPNAACVVALVDRLVHRSEIVKIDGESYRHKEAQERHQRRARQRHQTKETAE